MRHYLSFADGTELDVSAICNSKDTLLKDPRCTVDFKSAASSAQFTLKYAPGTAYDPITGNSIDKISLFKSAVSKIVVAIYNKEEVRVIIKSNDLETIMFRGYLNPSNFNHDLARIPGDAVVSCKDYTTDLDKVIGHNLVLENKSVNEIVETLINLCYSDGSHTYVGTGESNQITPGDRVIISSIPDSVIKTPFVLKEEEKKTYRQVIDTLLLEVPGYVLHYLHNSNRFEIVPSITPPVVNEIPRQIHFKISDKVKLKTGVYQYDGIQLNWPTIHGEDNVNVYSESIDIKYQEDKYIGQMLGYKEFFPTDGDIKKTEQQFRMPDRDYATGVSRLQNNDLTLLYARNCELDISAMDIPVTNKGSVADLDTLEAIEDQKIGDYYTVINVDGEGTVGYRVWDGSKWHATEQMSLANGVGNKYVYMGEVASKSNLPASSTEGYWYSIAGSTEAWVWEDGAWCRKYRQFALPVMSNLEGMVDNPMWYPGKMWTLLQNRSGGLVNLQALSVKGHAVWRDKLNKTTEPQTIKNPEEYDATYIFDQTEAEAFALWLYNAKKVACTTVQWSEPETMPIRSRLGERIKVKFFDGFEALFCVIQINDKGISKDLREYQCTAVLVEGFASENTGSTESTQTGAQPSKTIIDITEEYASTSDGVNVPSSWSPSRVVEKGKYLWTKITTTYSDGTKQESVSVVYNGDDGENAEVFRFKLSQETYLRDKRSSGNNPAITLTADIQGITATPYWFADYGSGYTYLGTESTYSLTIPMNNSYDTVKLGMGNASSWASSTKKFELSISVIDQTRYGIFLGATTRANVSGMVYEAGRPRDYYVDITDGNTYEYDGSTPWVLSTDINKLMFALDTLTRIPGVDLSNYQDPNTVSQFNTIIALKVIVGHLFSQAITILTGGHIKGGSRYDASGTIVNWSKDGFWFGADGKIKANLQSDNAGNTFVGTNVGTKTVISSTSGATGNYNTAVGYGAMNKNTTGDKNVAIGYYALTTNTTGTENVAIGNSALAYTTTGDNNVAIGTGALTSNTTGNSNIAIGHGAMNYNTTGLNNTAVGYNALFHNSSGYYNTAYGQEALNANTSGTSNTAVGYGALTTTQTGTQNTAVGEGALKVSTVSSNTAVGYHALYANTSGTGNTAVGTSAGGAVTTGSNNTIVGRLSMNSVTTGTNNTALGKSVFTNLTTGSYNVGIGTSINAPSATGSRQININDCLTYVEFKSARTQSATITELKKYLTANGMSLYCLGYFGTEAVNRISRESASTINVYAMTSEGYITTYTLGNYSTTLGKRLTLFFANPARTSSTEGDCLGA